MTPTLARQIACLALIVAVVLGVRAVPSARVDAAGPRDAAISGVAVRRDAEGRVRLAPGRPALSSRHGEVALAALPSLYGDCSILAYQSWDGDDFELWTARGNGSDPVRLTENQHTDETPYLAPDGTWFAYSADVGGNHDLYAMNVDGSDVRRLTTHASEDWFPSISPDGTRIAFQSYREGDQADIYVLTVATGAVTRLTRNASYDGQPDWSPDGTRIAFISDRAQVGDKNVWVMDADGSDANKITSHPSTGGPRWSPDGQTIVHAADDQDNGFPSLWAVDPNGANPRLLWRAAGDLSDVWPGGWSFDSRYVIYEEATWYWDNSAGEWYVSTAYLDAIAGDGSGERHRLTGLGINMAASWRFRDETTPISTISPLPQVSPSPAIISWWGADTCTDDLAFSIQYRHGSAGVWTDWSPTPGETWTVARYGHFEWSRQGSVVYFRSRARDASGHTEAWPSGSGDAYTSFPARIRGQVIDCRDAPIAGAEVVGPLPVRVPTHSGATGDYWLDASCEGSGTIRATAPLYAAQSLAQPGVAAAEGIVFALSDPENVITNGGFESGQVGWYARGGAQAQSSTTGYGRAVARIGEGYGGGQASGAADEIPPGSGPGPNAWVPALWRSVTVSIDMHRPTLSFLYALGDKAAEDGARFSASIGAGGNETVVFACDEPTPWRAIDSARVPVWQHAWADLSPWAGQTVTVTLSHDPAWTTSYALVDEVSVGPWLTPRIEAVSPARGPAGSAIPLTIAGDNLDGQGGGVTASLGATPLTLTRIGPTRLTATIPTTLPVGLYDLTVRTEAGHHAIAPAAYAVGGVVLVPLIVTP